MQTLSLDGYSIILERLTYKQRRLVQFRVAYPELSNSKIILMAGYRPSCITAGGQKVIKSTKVRRAIMETLVAMSRNPAEHTDEDSPIYREMERRAFGRRLLEGLKERA